MRSSLNTERSWYALYTRGRHEKRVDASLRDRGFEAYLPLVPRLRQWHDRKKLVEFPMFPSYVFARASLEELRTALSIPGVSTVLRFNGRPVAVPSDEIDNVRRFAAALAAAGGVDAEAGPLIEKGTPVSVISGPFEGVRGVVVERRGVDRALIQIGVRVIRQGIKLEVEAKDLELTDDVVA